jgi:Flp pilus assembly protein TadB
MSPLVVSLLFGAGLALLVFAVLPIGTAINITIKPSAKKLSVRMAERLRRAGVFDQAPTFAVGAIIGIGLILGAVAILVSGSPFFFFVGFIAPMLVVHVALLRRERQFMIRVMRDLPPFLSRFQAAINSNVPPAVAYRQGVARSKVLREVLGESASRMAAGADFVEALESTIDKLPLRMWRVFVRQIAAHAAAGGDLATALSVTVTQINTMLSVQAEAAANTAGQRFQQTIVFLIIIGGLLMFAAVMGKDMISLLFTTIPGLVVVVLGGGMIAHGFYFSMRQIKLIDDRMAF